MRDFNRKSCARESDFYRFERIYKVYNHPEFIHPDPLEYVVGFEEPEDQEVAGLVAATLAFGRIGHILKSLETVFRYLEKPAADLASMSNRELQGLFGAFRHRWTTGDELSDLLIAVKTVRKDYGSLENCFKSGIGGADANVIPALTSFVAALKAVSGEKKSSLLACPTGGSACKRLMLYLRWMARRDEVDPGPWKCVPTSMLVIPMDTHMYRLARRMGLTMRKQADLKCALEVTAYFKELCPEDPVRYDFSMTRPGIRGEPDFTGIPGFPGEPVGF